MSSRQWREEEERLNALTADVSRAASVLRVPHLEEGVGGRTLRRLVRRLDRLEQKFRRQAWRAASKAEVAEEAELREELAD